MMPNSLSNFDHLTSNLVASNLVISYTKTLLAYQSTLPWIFPGAPLTFNGSPGNIQGNLTALSLIVNRDSERLLFFELLVPFLLADTTAAGDDGDDDEQEHDTSGNGDRHRHLRLQDLGSARVYKVSKQVCE